MEVGAIIEQIRSAFCKLTDFKVGEHAIEVITAHSSMNGKFISVFVTQTKGKIVVTDNGWIDQNYYNTPLYEESEDIVGRLIHSYQSSFSVKSTLDREGVEYFYKVCERIEDIPSAVYDLASFSVGVVNAFCVQYKDEKEEKERESFRKDANDFLKANYADDLKLRASLDDFKNIRFNAVVNKGSDLYLLTYVTGSSPYYFENDLRRSIVNFEITERSKYKNYIREKITLFNNTADGYRPEKSSSLIHLLGEKTSRDPILWSDKERILELI